MVVYWNENEIPVLPDRAIFFRPTMVGHSFISLSKKKYLRFVWQYILRMHTLPLIMFTKKNEEIQKCDVYWIFITHSCDFNVKSSCYFSLSMSSLLYFVKGIHFLLSHQFTYGSSLCLSHSRSLVYTLIRHSYCSRIYLRFSCFNQTRKEIWSGRTICQILSFHYYYYEIFEYNKANQNWRNHFRQFDTTF